MSEAAAPTPITLHCETRGDGKPLVLLHGFGANAFTWRHLMERLPAGYRAFALDLKGFGQSPKPRDNAYAMEDQANLVCDFIERNGLKSVALAGHSMGGGVAALTAMKLCDRGAPPSALILIDTISFPQRVPLFIGVLRTPVLNWMVVTLVPAVTLVRGALNLAFHDWRKVTAKMVRAYSTPFKQPGGRHAAIATAMQIIPANIDALIARLPDLKIPTLILWGREDPITPLAHGERLAQVIPHARLVVIDRCGHIPQEERPDETIPAIATFLETSR